LVSGASAVEKKIERAAGAPQAAGPMTDPSRELVGEPFLGDDHSRLFALTRRLDAVGSAQS
jgi:hypothetical protein